MVRMTMLSELKEDSGLQDHSCSKIRNCPLSCHSGSSHPVTLRLACPYVMTGNTGLLPLDSPPLP